MIEPENVYMVVAIAVPVTVSPPELMVSAPSIAIDPARVLEPVTRLLNAVLMSEKLLSTSSDTIVVPAVKATREPIWATAMRAPYSCGF